MNRDERDWWYVDAREWEDHWRDQWVGFIDLLGFSAVAPYEATTTNLIVRFHQVLARAAEAHPECQFFRLTDCAFVVGDTLTSVLATATTVNHDALALNRSLIDRGGDTKSHHLILPRTSISTGKVLRIEPEAVEDLGVDPNSMLAGPAVVSAYRTERHGTAFEVLLSQRTKKEAQDLDGPHIKAAEAFGLDLREWPQTVPEALEYSTHVTFPWMAMRRQERSDELRLDDRANTRDRLRQLLEVQAVMDRGFLIDDGPVVVGKHIAGLRRLVGATASWVNGNAGRTSPHTALADLA